MLFILFVVVENKKYYVTDLSGSLSRSIQDSMLFLNEFAAETYAGPIENLIERKTKKCATIGVLHISVTGIIPKTAVECVPSPWNDYYGFLRKNYITTRKLMRTEGEGMNVSIKEKRQEAINKIVPIAMSLTSGEWQAINSIICQHFSIAENNAQILNEKHLRQSLEQDFAHI